MQLLFSVLFILSLSNSPCRGVRSRTGSASVLEPSIVHSDFREKTSEGEVIRNQYLLAPKRPPRSMFSQTRVEAGLKSRFQSFTPTANRSFSSSVRSMRNGTSVTLVEKDDYSSFVMVEQAGSNAPLHRAGHSLRAIGKEVVLFGGCGAEASCYNDITVFDTRTGLWEIQTPQDYLKAPSPRAGHVAELYGRNLIIFSGHNGAGFVQDIWKFNLDTNAWGSVNLTGIPPAPRSRASSTIVGNGKIVVYGGYNENNYPEDVILINMVKRRWEYPKTSGDLPGGRQGAAMIYDKNRVYLFGGTNSKGDAINSIHYLDLPTFTWHFAKTTSPKMFGRSGLTAIKSGEYVYLFGGCDQKRSQCFNDTHRYDLKTGELEKLDEGTNASFSPRQTMSGATVGREMYFFGGKNLSNTHYNDMHMYNLLEGCSSDCSGNGKCVNDACVCENPWIGSDCDLQVRCNNECSGNGTCQSSGECKCFTGYSGEDCSQRETNLTLTGSPTSCLNNCSGNGLCDNASGLCKCFAPFTGSYCETSIESQFFSSELANSRYDYRSSSGIFIDPHQEFLDLYNSDSDTDHDNDSDMDGYADNDIDNDQDESIPITKTNPSFDADKDTDEVEEVDHDRDVDEDMDEDKDQDQDLDDEVEIGDQVPDLDFDIDQDQDKDQDKDVDNDVDGLISEGEQHAASAATTTEKAEAASVKAVKCEDTCSSKHGTCYNDQCYCANGWVGSTCTESKDDYEEGWSDDDCAIVGKVVAVIAFIAFLIYYFRKGDESSSESGARNVDDGGDAPSRVNPDNQVQNPNDRRYLQLLSEEDI
mmetsp:Transcript_17848/g.20248  ORF Transcript_17848/g.20248 Transcript_17848/m.20248 type:complete len:811 (+) Transcript_17848:136-2568(+)